MTNKSLDFLKNQKQISLKWLAGLSAVILFVILIAGINPYDFNFSNGVNWIKDQPGIRFGKYGIAYTHPFIEFGREDLSEPTGFSIEIALKPASYRKTGFNVMLAIHSGKEINNLLLVQVHSRIYLISGGNFRLNRETKRIRSILVSPTPTTQLVTITTENQGSSFYLNGQLVQTKKDLTIQIPNGRKARLLLGNSEYGKHSWQGEVYGLALYEYTLTARDIKIHYNRWYQDQNFLFAEQDKPLALYFFDEKRGERAIDHSGGNHHLEIPLRMKIFKKKILSQEWSELRFNKNFYEDSIINVVGFIPFGFILAVTLIKLGGTCKKHHLFMTVSFCFAVSLIIEIIQAWIPSRSSEIRDLILNTLGALIGLIILKIFILMIYSKRALKAGD